MPQFLNDTFTDADNTALASHTGETGATWTLYNAVNAAGSATIQSNRVRGNAAGSQGSFFYASGTSLNADYFVEATLDVQSLLASSYSGVIGRALPGSSDFYWAIYNVASSAWQLWKTVAGTATMLGFFSATPSGSAVLRLDMVGSTIRVLIDGTQRISVSDSSLSSAGRAGVVFFGVMTPTTGVHITTITASDSGAALTAGSSSVTSTGLTTATVTAVAPTGGTSPYTYQWYRSTSSGFTPGAGNIISGATSLTRNDTGLARGTTYYYRCIQTDSASASVTTSQITATTKIRQIVCDGDSITFGQNLSAGQDYPSQMQAILGSTWQINNVAVSGQTCAQMQSSRTDVDSLFAAANTSNVVVAAGGTNDIYFNADADDAGATTYARIVAYCNACRSTGFRVVVCTLLPRNDFPGSSTLPSPQQTRHETRRLAINALIRTNWRFFSDSLCDWAADVRIGEDGDYNDTTYFQTDKVHPTATGAALIAARVATAVAVAINAGGSATYTAASNVRSGTDRGDGTLGTLAVPTASQVLNGVAVDATTGNVVLPSVGDVRVGTTYGAASVLTGTLNVATGTYTAAANVRFGTDRGDGILGTLRVPTASQVLSGVSVDATTGNVVLPSVGDVQSAVAYGASSSLVGTFAVPAESQVQSGVGYGAGGTEFSGTLTGGAGGLTTDQWAALSTVLGLPSSGTTPTMPTSGALSKAAIRSAVAGRWTDEENNSFDLRIEDIPP